MRSRIRNTSIDPIPIQKWESEKWEIRDNARNKIKFRKYECIFQSSNDLIRHTRQIDADS